MANFFDKIVKKSRNKDYEIQEGEGEFIELNTDNLNITESGKKILIKPFDLNEFSDTKQIVDSLREGNVIVLINISPLKEKDLMEVKRAIAKIKKTVDAINGDIAGFGEDYLVATPPFARIERRKKEQKKQEDSDFEDY